MILPFSYAGCPSRYLGSRLVRNILCFLSHFPPTRCFSTGLQPFVLAHPKYGWECLVMLSICEERSLLQLFMQYVKSILVMSS